MHDRMTHRSAERSTAGMAQQLYPTEAGGVPQAPESLYSACCSTAFTHPFKMSTVDDALSQELTKN